MRRERRSVRWTSCCSPPKDAGPLPSLSGPVASGALAGGVGGRDAPEQDLRGVRRNGADLAERLGQAVSGLAGRAVVAEMELGRDGQAVGPLVVLVGGQAGLRAADRGRGPALAEPDLAESEGRVDQ